MLRHAQHERMASLSFWEFNIVKIKKIAREIRFCQENIGLANDTDLIYKGLLRRIYRAEAFVQKIQVVTYNGLKKVTDAMQHNPFYS